MPGLQLGQQWTTPDSGFLFMCFAEILTCISKAEGKREQFIPDHKKDIIAVENNVLEKDTLK